MKRSSSDVLQLATPPPSDSSDDLPPVPLAPKRRLEYLGSLLRVALPVAMLAAGWVAYSMLAVESEEAKSPPPEEQVISTRVTQLEIQDYRVLVTTHGVVQSHNEVTLSARVSGRITHVSPALEVGSFFSTGDVLVELDARDYETAVAVAKAQREVATAALELATQNHDRKMKLFDNQIVSVSEAELNQSLAAKAQAAAELDSAAAQLEQAKRDLERTKVLAPFDGRVLQKMVGLGQSVGVDTPLGVVFAVDFAEVRLPIAGRELQFLELPEMSDDPPVEVQLTDAIQPTPTTTWKARIVRTEGALDENSLELFAIARVDDPFGLKSGHPPLRIGQPVAASIAGKVLIDVVALPRVAVRQLDQILLVDPKEQTLHPKTIVPLWSDEEQIIVRDPEIQEGMLLSTTHLVYAPSGAKVEIIEDSQLEPATTSVAGEKEEGAAH